MCQAYISKYNLDIVIGRFSRIYGPTMQMQDSKAIAQFIKNAVNGEDIVLKSEGNQYYSYCYVADAVGAMLKIIFDGTNGEAYNISDKNSDITLKDLAKILASYNNKEVVFQLPDEKERKGYSTATLAIMNSEKLKKIGWNAHYDMKNGLERTIEIIKSRKISK
ncbi:MAG: NAD(P)-dependent oxidoreductase [Oscillospiraceae bacterium]|nr:NAD(P)-dependent oxidoreductase [Oscillospiraceae bacterium]